jgi:hypothetical protein
MEWITTDSVIKCGHDGKIQNKQSQEWFRIGQEPGKDHDKWPYVLREADPEGRDINACPNYGVNVKPCRKTLKVAKGYSEWITIEGKPVVLSHLDGLTDGTVPGTVHYQVREPKQTFVRADK